MKKSVICDIDGVLLHDNTAVPGAKEFLARLIEQQTPLVILTNYPVQTAQDLANGARFIATNPDTHGPSYSPACGALCAPIEKITGRKPFFVGKPSPWIIRAALNKIQAHSESTLIIGDNLRTDILAGFQAGLETVLVLSGVSKRTDIEAMPFRPNHVFDSVAEIDII